MEARSLANTYRPGRIDDIVGNAKLKRVLNSFLEQERFPQAMMIVGGTGLGKTTTARIIAKHASCDVGTVCGECRSCEENLDDNTDIVEMDIGDTRGINDIRDLKEQLQYAPMIGRMRVAILDECHQLTQAGGSALLKVLEEPPSHVMFILCTTDPHKVLPTIRGRCKELEVQSPSFKDMGQFLVRIAKGEKVKITKAHTPILKEIYRLSNGHVRDAVQMFESFIALLHSDNDYTEEEIITSLTTDSTQEAEFRAIDILRGYLEGDPALVIRVMSETTDQRAILYKLKFLVDVVLADWSGHQKFTPPVLREFKDECPDFVGDGFDLKGVLRLGAELAKIEVQMNTGVNDSVLKYTVSFLAACRQKDK